MTTTRTLTGGDIIAELMARVAKLEQIVICQHCEDGITTHKRLGKIACIQCSGTGNRIDGMDVA